MQIVTIIGDENLPTIYGFKTDKVWEKDCQTTMNSEGQKTK